MRLINTWLLVLICITVSSCSLIDGGCLPDDTPGQYRLSSLSYYFSDKTSNPVKFIYNGDGKGKLIRKDWYNTKNEIDFYEDFIYEQGRLTNIKRNLSENEFAQVRFVFENDHVKTVEYWIEEANTSLSKSHSIEFEYTDGQISKSISTFYNDSPAYYSLYTFTDGNIVSVKAYDLATNQLLEENTYKYDNKPNPFYKMSNQYLGSPIASSKNNMVHYKIVSYKHIPQNPELSFAYTYNDKGYPVEKYIIDNTGKKYLDESFTYEFSH
jgi:hypothetical protein